MNIEAMDLNLLVVLEALIEERSVTRAAGRVGLSQPAMSNALARLRRTIGDPLLTRTAEGMMPTPAAQTLIVPVRNALRQLREAFEERAAFDPAGSERVFDLLTTDYVEITLLAPMLKSLRRVTSQVRWRIHRPAYLFEPPPAALLADTHDLAIGFYPNVLSLDARLHSEDLWEEKNVCLVASGHPTIRKNLSLEQYATAGHIAPFYKQEGQGIIDTILSQLGYQRQVTVRTPHFASIPFIVSITDLIATVPERLALEFSRKLPLRMLPLPIDLPAFRLALLWHQRHHSDPAHEWIRHQIAEAAGKLKVARSPGPRREK